MRLPDPLPPPLVAGEPVAVVTPSSPPLEADLAAGLEAIAGLGFDPRPVDVVTGSEGFLAGDDAARRAALDRAATEGFRAVWAARGGYGLTRVLPGLPLAAWAAAPRTWVGFSDLTALFAALGRSGAGLCVHGPLATTLASEPSKVRHALGALLTDPEGAAIRLQGSGLAPGRAAGPLVGGNLTMLAALLGTPCFPSLAGGVLLLEEVGEAPYRIDRLLTQLRHAGALERVAGVAVGHLVEGTPPPDRGGPDLLAVVAERLGGLGVPVVTGLPFGHAAPNFPLPLGVEARLDGTAGTLVVEAGWRRRR